ncbi:MAG: 16S rRNA (cytidine(1402)-2'-O)-methyltransferase [Candidatus Electronema sp. V4]|uniref:16S rRNA (cytidine(1402)-2'-O)-methyltransferase n=1 Tax=Candidatus Electronema sp. V4 TaxID=3454756 RepID=UPI00405568D1
MSASASKPGILHIAATPIGNLGDISQRLRETLATADLIACEDTRHTRKLLSHLNISAKLTSCHRDNEQQKAGSLVERLLAGESVVFVSDAGTPGLSDPGAALVRAARAAGITVVPVPGPSALAAALSVAGLTESAFYFGGFLAAKKSARRKQLAALNALPCPLIFYEAPHRIQAALQDCLEVLGDRPAQLFRELTKLHEEHLAGPLSGLLERMSGKALGEFVLLISGAAERQEEKPDNLDELIHWHRDQGSSLKDAARQIAEALDMPKSQVYQQALRLWEQ